MKVDRCPQCKRRLVRNNDQNRRLWAIYHVVSEKVKAHGKTYSADTWHLFFKSKFLGCDDHILPSKKVLSIPRSTASLDVAEFAAYMEQVEAWSNERGAFLEDEPYAA